jgi:hypothetical protein
MTESLEAQRTAFDVPKIISAPPSAERRTSPSQAQATDCKCQGSLNEQSESSLWRRTQDLDGLRRCFFVCVICVPPIGIAFEAAHDGFVGFVEDRAEKSLR